MSRSDAHPTVCIACGHLWADHAVGGNCKYSRKLDTTVEDEIREFVRAHQPAPLVYLPRGLPDSFIGELRRMGARLWFGGED